MTQCMYSSQGEYICQPQQRYTPHQLEAFVYEPNCNNACAPSTGYYDYMNHRCVCTSAATKQNVNVNVATVKAPPKPCEAKCKYGRCEPCK